MTSNDYGNGSAREMRIPIPPGTVEIVIGTCGYGGGWDTSFTPPTRRQRIWSRTKQALWTAAFVFLSWFGVTLAIEIVKTWLL